MSHSEGRPCAPRPVSSSRISTTHIRDGTYDFFLETQIDCPGSYPQLSTAELDEKRQRGIQEQVVTMQPEFASLGTVVCSLKFEMRVSFVMAASFTDAKETTLTEK